MKSGFDYKEFLEWSKNIGVAKKEFHNWLKSFLLEEAQKVVEKGKPRTPVDTGYLRNSWYIGSQKIKQDIENGKATINWKKSDIASIKVIGDILQVEIGLSADYASFIEYGHHSYEGRYMLTISIDEVQRELPARFNKAWLLFLQEKGVV